jgi:hypothetical protein
MHPLLALTLFGCQPEPLELEPPVEALPAERAGPTPYRAEFELRATNAIAGQALELTAITGTPGGTVEFVVSRAGLGSGASLYGENPGVRSPYRVLAPVIADARGVARLTYNVALLQQGNWLAAQAFLRQPNDVIWSNTIERLVGPFGTVIASGVDSDGDGFTVLGGDCAEFEPRMSPAAADRPDTHDQNCDDRDGVDADGDGWASVITPGYFQADCDDSDASIRPYGSEICDGRDSNCDGVLPQIGSYAGAGGGVQFPQRPFTAMHYEVTQDIRIEHVRFMGTVTAPWSTVLRVYDATAPGQPYHLLATFPTAVADAQAGWYRHADVRLALWQGHRYVFEIEGTGPVGVWGSGAPAPTQRWHWGLMTSSWTSSSPFVDGAVAPNPSNDTPRVELISMLEVDQDLDGEVACRDCDDHDATVGICPP